MLSIIIPTYNEEKYLGRLLRLIKNQSYQPKEIIVADNRSTDRTVLIARKFGCRVIKGGTPAQGRTAGGKAATGGIFLFLDADVVFKGRNFLKRIINDYKNNRNSIATVWFVSQERNFLNKFICWVANLNKKINLIITKKWRVVIGDYGLFIICSRSIFNTVGFFSTLATNAITMEDTLFFRETIKKGAQYRVLPEKIYISGRRLKNKNLFRLLTWGTLCLLIITASFFKLRVNRDMIRMYEEIRKGR
ncbi:hypothetical protein COY13_04750 [Candidatus Roizmanbacteria bacterium CG_4_10_14_0_2_um_filter_36_35]|uniref:Glycosyltransferase 2-like domain-containing protein n=4 Tax=Candidatus Roizmaniibacteriota TaxID=1752723 RepID=A0A2M7BWD9_9BACT|nr:MAG: hypothetical protein COV86_01685 [Candidatus Roizmanbacteria bacterium CG11_big_fil_rev_8_21_14_0_20_35_14]PIV10888.1 MAG: hypothetical protein COS50_03035 [Candidatus Roizmanbacteria bacterium CG03_land_8_20_14_0_80_35_26]PIZ66826.1 MAG: hypothetical protein COY13_04750 [Candidatus Roizmanbacteria bacterium CG_4_10_14_0_2_um_filter_36_35]PJC33724.1 MAG: hypothetical protein CO049_00010 [Candidatus Roizmanbacteria bacterium CG_4_9_14_0_2_um_filter_36_12]PJC79883.1 MAG: hypothetical prot